MIRIQTQETAFNLNLVKRETITERLLVIVIFLLLFPGKTLAGSIVDVPLAGVNYDDPKVQFKLGLMYDVGRDVPQDYKEAVTWFTKSAEQGFGPAQYSLGVMYADGHGVPQNYEEAVKWYTKSAVQGFAPAQYNLGVMYHKGRGVPQNYNKSFEWYTKSAEQGYAKAQSNLGVLYFNGQGTPENYVEAYAWLSVAAARGDDVAGQNRDKVKEEMTAEQIAKGQEMTADLFKKYGEDESREGEEDWAK